MAIESAIESAIDERLVRTDATLRRWTRPVIVIEVVRGSFSFVMLREFGVKRVEEGWGGSRGEGR